MRYLFVSDVHGKYDKLITALNAAKFNKDTDTLVCLGDMFDRGSQSKEVLDFILELPNCICVWGNHDLRLRDLVFRGEIVDRIDKDNGVLETIRSFVGDNLHYTSNSLSTLRILLSYFKTASKCVETKKKLLQYFNKCRFYIEFDNLVAVHGWIPVKLDKLHGNYILDFDKNWRTATEEQWEQATWIDGIYAASCNCNTYKPMVVGHINAWQVPQMRGVEVYRYTPNENQDNYNYKCLRPEFVGILQEFNNVYFIDGGAPLKEGKVIVFEYKTDEKIR